MSQKPKIGFTKSEQILVNILADGRKHSITELCQALDGEYTTREAIRFHVFSIRRKLSEGEDILATRVQGSSCYVWVRLLPSAYNGKH